MTEKMANRMSALDDEDTNSLTSFNLLGPVGEKLISPCCISVSPTGEYLVHV
jgi:hypothetical protein